MKTLIITISLLTVLPNVGKAQPIGGTALVAAIKADAIQRGKLQVPQRDNCDAFQITARVAWATRDQGARLILKGPAQNGCSWNGVRYSHDAIAYPGGFMDVLHSAGPPANVNGPAWDWTASGPCSNCDAPVDLDAGTEPPVVVPPVNDFAERLNAAERLLAEQAQKINELVGLVNGLNASVAAAVANTPKGCQAFVTLFGMRLSAKCELTK